MPDNNPSPVEAFWLTTTDVQKIIAACEPTLRKKQLFKLAFFREGRLFFGETSKSFVKCESRILEYQEREADGETDLMLAHHLFDRLNRCNAEAAYVVGCEASYPIISALRCVASTDDESLAGALNHTGNACSHSRSSYLSIYNACCVAREIFGNSFRKHLPDRVGLSAWNGGVIPALARAIYEENRWDEVGILGDMLEDAGCQDQDAIDHCHGKMTCTLCAGTRLMDADGKKRKCLSCLGRGLIKTPFISRSHWRGCWVIDAILGKS